MRPYPLHPIGRDRGASPDRRGKHVAAYGDASGCSARIRAHALRDLLQPGVLQCRDRLRSVCPTRRGPGCSCAWEPVPGDRGTGESVCKQEWHGARHGRGAASSLVPGPLPGTGHGVSPVRGSRSARTWMNLSATNRALMISRSWTLRISRFRSAGSRGLRARAESVRQELVRCGSTLSIRIIAVGGSPGNWRPPLLTPLVSAPHDTERDNGSLQSGMGRTHSEPASGCGRCERAHGQSTRIRSVGDASRNGSVPAASPSIWTGTRIGADTATSCARRISRPDTGALAPRAVRRRALASANGRALSNRHTASSRDCGSAPAAST